MTDVKEGFALSGIAICNVCLQPCIIWYDNCIDIVKSKCCNAHISHTNVKVKFKKEKFP